MSFQIVQIFAGFVGSIGYGVLFNLRGKRLVWGAIGGLLSWSIFVLLSLFISNEIINYFFVSVLISIYAEIFARILRTPTTPLIITSLMPLIPGGSLYYTIAAVFNESLDVFFEKAFYTLKLAAALALGVIVVLAAWRFVAAKPLKKEAKD